MATKRRLRIQGDRMSVIVEMFRRTAAPNRFSCSLPVWELLWDLGHTFGWHPKGTNYVLPAKSAVEVPARRNYEPGDSQDHKRVAEEDAMAWARAMQRAKESSHIAAMLEARSAALADSGKTGGELLPGVIDEFIEFAYGGGFEFAIRRKDRREIDEESGNEVLR